MLFHTWIFLLFVLVFFPVFFLVRNNDRLRIGWFLLTSYVFYGWWDPRFLILIIYATWINWMCVEWMERTGHRKTFLWVGMLNSLGLLGYFKYADFLVGNLNQALAALGAAQAFGMPGVILPVGISFFTFQAMSYTIDYYRGDMAREPSLFRFATFVALFPQLVAGPIERATNLLPQIARKPKITREDVLDGMSLFVVGLFKKAAMADYLAIYVDKVYSQPGSFDAPALLMATFFFAWQIYFDFSGYTDMARGVARLMGIRLMLNFNNPYTAVDLGDFWGRWHISLSTWFKDYVYIPLGGNRHGRARTYFNMFATMVISGFWHGAAWTFIIWGALHGLGRLVTREVERTSFYRDRVPRLVKQLLIFTFVLFTWIFFRARSVEDAWLIVSRIFTAAWTNPEVPLLALVVVLSIWAYELIYNSQKRPVLVRAPIRVALVVAMILFLIVASPAGEQAFIYFQF